MTWKGFVAAVLVAPVLAMFVGVGLLAYQIGQTWDQRNTDALVTALASICAGGAVIVGLLLALIVGVPLALRAYERGGMTRQAWPEQPAQWRMLPPTGQQPPWIEQPPMLTDKQQGQWLSQGAQQYDLWDSSPETIDR